MYFRIIIVNTGHPYFLNVNGDTYLNQVKNLLKTPKYDVYLLVTETYNLINKYRFYVPADKEFSLKDSMEMKGTERIPIVVICFDAEDRIMNCREHFPSIFFQRPDGYQAPISEWLLSLGCQKETKTKAKRKSLELSPRHLKKESMITQSANQFTTITGI